MARKALVEKLKSVKFSVRYRNRCELCGRPRGYMRFFKLCRICFRQLASDGKLPGVKKAVW
ncbi:TPA: type Z 30S ribosomal protein S14 [Candidatus Dependentiae bacterium]|nr:MAG: 30S ribosomal protein S14 type Z [candidate division TM6 bacterium GW2011_GWF2_36_131]KKQ03073.1 MAG: 30S ribosomal protein S14 type Z [candidate division TM6 bacterium GW2011_GWE2_36_25]KKQ18430.1 MAG: 30S ribosomal protein S14 type Z [candidate division TM6 bacterium GW2011_GWA2_36_9]HBR71155.1 type Z 30S ribosomal protein S14 [Candidatus Dependentiae bacterium]HCU00468.1 type Z 30S ribosomal protein S14 [Candidatus Dependentiae bacterium]